MSTLLAGGDLGICLPESGAGILYWVPNRHANEYRDTALIGLALVGDPLLCPAAAVQLGIVVGLTPARRRGLLLGGFRSLTGGDRIRHDLLIGQHLAHATRSFVSSTGLSTSHLLHSRSHLYWSQSGQVSMRASSRCRQFMSPASCRRGWCLGRGS